MIMDATKDVVKQNMTALCEQFFIFMTEQERTISADVLSAPE